MNGLPPCLVIRNDRALSSTSSASARGGQRISGEPSAATITINAQDGYTISLSTKQHPLVFGGGVQSNRRMLIFLTLRSASRADPSRTCSRDLIPAQIGLCLCVFQKNNPPKKKKKEKVFSL